MVDAHGKNRRKKPLPLPQMEEMEETEAIRFVEEFFLTSGGTNPSLLEVPLDNGKLSWERSESGPVLVHGRSNGACYVVVQIDRWKLELPPEGKPTVLVRQMTGSWIELREPSRSYFETMKIILVAAFFLAFAKQNPNSTKGDVWRYLRKDCGNFKSKPHPKDLIQAFLLCRSVVTSDPELQESPIIRQFYPSFSTKRRPRVAQGFDLSGKSLRVNRRCSAVSEDLTFGSSRLGVKMSKGRSSSQSTPETHRVLECEASTPVVDSLSGEPSLQSTPKTPTPAVCEASPRREPSMPSTPMTRRDAEFEVSPLVTAISKGGSSLQSTPNINGTAECEAAPVVADILKGETSLLSTPTTRSLLEFAAEADLPPSRKLTSESKKRKPGKPGRRSSRKSRKGSDKERVVRDDDWIDEPDVCAFCDDGVEKGDKLLCCDGLCMRSFHPTIYSGKQNKCPTLCLTKSTFSVKTWICPNCEAEQHQCFACGKLGNSTPSSDSQEVFVCGAKQCKRFYHPACVAKLLVPDHLVPGLCETAQKDLAFRIQSKSEPFICPLHDCASCHLEENKTDPRLCLIKCRRCPTAWHEQCLPVECRNQLWPLEGGQHVMYCGRHKLDPELLTPKRDHIKFPVNKPGGRVRSPNFSRLLLSLKRPSSVSPHRLGGPLNRTPYHTVKDIITETSRLVTIDSVKKGMGIFSNT